MYFHVMVKLVEYGTWIEQQEELVTLHAFSPEQLAQAVCLLFNDPRVHKEPERYGVHIVTVKDERNV